MKIGDRQAPWILAGVLALAGGCNNDDSAAADETGESGGSDSGSESGGGDGDGDSQDLPPIDPTICPGMEFDNVIDEAACPEIWGRGHQPQLADDVELCRRLHVDLFGRLPTQSEYEATCEGKSVEAIVDDLMARPEYVQLGQRMWADVLHMTSDLSYYEYLVELDALAGQVYAGDMNLPEFAELASVHPGFTGRFDGQDLVGYSFQAFLGRDAAPHERIGLFPLWRMLEERFYDQHPDYYFGYTLGVVNSIRCMAGAAQDCHSDLWGHHSVILPVVEEGNYDYQGVNVYPVEGLSADEWNILRLPGRLIAQHPTFFEAQADRSLVRYLGYEAGQELPAARQAMVEMYTGNGGAIRPVERELLTSVLYAMSHDAPDAPDTPVEAGTPNFWQGPHKQMQAEVWLDSLEAFSGVELGHCDHRFPDVQNGRPTDTSPYEDTVWHPSNYPKDVDGWPETANKPDYTYRGLANALGGCPDQQGQQRFTGTGVMVSIARDAIAQAVCGALQEGGGPLLPPNFDASDTSEQALSEVAAHFVRSTTLREPNAEQLDAISISVDGCRDDAECTPELFAFHICTAVLKTAPNTFQ